MVMHLKPIEKKAGQSSSASDIAQEKAKARFMRDSQEGCSTALEIAVGAAFAKVAASGKKPAPEGTGNTLPRISSIFSRGSATQHPKDPQSGSQENKKETQGCSTALEIAVGHAFGKVMVAQKDHNDRYLLEGQLKTHDGKG